MGQSITIIPDKSACYKCLFPNLDDKNMPSCGATGVHPSILGIISNIGVVDVINILVGRDPVLEGVLLHVDLNMMMIKTKIERADECEVCGMNRKKREDELLILENLCGRISGKRTFAVTPKIPYECEERKITDGDILLQYNSNGGCITVGAKDEAEAKEAYDRNKQ